MISEIRSKEARMAGGDHEDHRDQGLAPEPGAQENVVRFPGDWVGPLADLVELRPSAERDRKKPIDRARGKVTDGRPRFAAARATRPRFTSKPAADATMTPTVNVGPVDVGPAEVQRTEVQQRADVQLPEAFDGDAFWGESSASLQQVWQPEPETWQAEPEAAESPIVGPAGAATADVQVDVAKPSTAKPSGSGLRRRIMIPAAAAASAAILALSAGMGLFGSPATIGHSEALVHVQSSNNGASGAKKSGANTGRTRTAGAAKSGRTAAEARLRERAAVKSAARPAGRAASTTSSEQTVSDRDSGSSTEPSSGQSVDVRATVSSSSSASVAGLPGPSTPSAP